MKTQYLIFLFIIKIINARISINIRGASNPRDASVTYTGTDTKIIGDYEIGLFGVDEKSLKAAVGRHFGRTPNDVFLKSPTPWGDLYKTYKWAQVSRILSVKSARVLGLTREPIVVLSQDFDNKSSRNITVNTGISQTVSNTITTSWGTGGQIEVSRDIKYDINFRSVGVSLTTGFTVTSSWAQNEEQSQAVTIGTTTSVQTVLRPGQSARAVLSATRGHLDVEVTYAAKLTGVVAANYKNELNGHHFWGPAIETVMRAGGIQNERTSRETIRVGFYTDATLKVTDKSTGRVLTERNYN